MSEYVARRLSMSLSAHHYEYIHTGGRGNTRLMVHAKKWKNKGNAEMYLLRKNLNTQYQVVRVGPNTSYYN